MAFKNIAGKHDEELSRMEEEIQANPSEVAEDSEEVHEETPPSVESAPIQAEESVEDTEVNDETEDSVATTSETEFTEEEWNALSEKTRQEMTRLREKSRRVDELEKTLEKDRKLAKVYAPLEEVGNSLREQSYKKSDFPWEEGSSEKVGKWASSLIEDIGYSEETYPELNPVSEDYDDELTATILQDYRNLRASNPETRLKDLVDRRMDSIKRAKDKALSKIKVLEEKKKQVASEVLPANTSSGVKKLTTEEKIGGASSLDELERLEKEIGISNRFK